MLHPQSLLDVSVMRNAWKEKPERGNLRDNTSRDDTVRDSAVKGTMMENDRLKEILKAEIWNVMLRDHTLKENTMRDIGTPQTPNRKTFLSSARSGCKAQRRDDISAFITIPQNPVPNKLRQTPHLKPQTVWSAKKPELQ